MEAEAISDVMMELGHSKYFTTLEGRLEPCLGQVGVAIHGTFPVLVGIGPVHKCFWLPAEHATAPASGNAPGFK